MKNKFYLTIGGLITILGSGGAYNEFDVQIVTGDQKIIVFDTKLDCLNAKKKIMEIFDKKELDTDQAEILKAFSGQTCGVFVDSSLPNAVSGMTVTENKVYYTKAEYLKRKEDLYKKTKEKDVKMDIFELRELAGIMNNEIKIKGKLQIKSFTPEGIIVELEK